MKHTTESEQNSNRTAVSPKNEKAYQIALEELENGEAVSLEDFTKQLRATEEWDKSL